MPRRKCSSVDSAFGVNLSYYRHLAGLTQQQVADMLNLNRSTYTKYETGVSEPSIEILKRIADILSIDYNSLLANADVDVDNSQNNNDFSDIKDELDSESRTLLRRYNGLCRDDREELFRVINSMYNRQHD